MTVRFTANFRVTRATTVALALDLARILAAPRLAAGDGSETTHSGDGDDLAPRLATAVERSVFWLEAKPGEAGPAGAVAAVRPPSAAGTPLTFTVPGGFPQPALPADNPLTVEGVALGRGLFRDRRLSAGGGQSCADCHDPARAFSDSAALSRGADGRPGTRHAMPLFNLAWSPAYAWDQTLAAMTSPAEMHADPAAVAAALARDAGVAAEFRAAFGSPEVTPERIGLALEQYLLTIVSADSRFDRARRGEAALTAEERRGLELFAMEYDPARGRRGADCFHCHGGLLFSDYGYKDNGLDLVAADAGRAKVTGSAGDTGKFKTPSLRNVAVTGPYMHDGRFATLEEVVAHYDHGVRRNANLDPNLAKHPDDGLQLGAADQAALVAFLRTLTDEKWAGN
jgi:cytochrome c peroxidase